MAIKTWISKQQKRAQINEIVLNSGISGVTYNVTMNGKTISFTTSGTVSDIGINSGLLSGLRASTEPEFQEVTWTGFGSGIRATAVTAGKPFTYTTSLSVTSGFMQTSGVTANLSPNDAIDGVNYDPSGVPADTGDDLFFDGRNLEGMKWNVDGLSGKQLNSLNVAAAYAGATAQIGLKELDEDGGYPQYRARHLDLSVTTVNVGKDAGRGIGLMKLNLLVSGLNVNVYKTGSPQETNREAITLLSTHPSGVLNLFNGSVGLAPLGSQSGMLPVVNMGPAAGTAPFLRVGFSPISGTLTIGNGTVVLNAPCYNLYQNTGNATVRGSGNVSNLRAGGSLTYEGTGPIGSGAVLAGATLNLGDAGPSLTISGRVDLHANSRLVDRSKRGTYASGFSTIGCGLEDVTVDFGPNRTYSVV